jgi:hypothetical protein
VQEPSCKPRRCVVMVMSYKSGRLIRESCMMVGAQRGRKAGLRGLSFLHSRLTEEQPAVRVSSKHYIVITRKIAGCKSRSKPIADRRDKRRRK